MIRRYSITLTVAAPVSSRSSELVNYGVDVQSMVTEDGRLILPGTEVTGHLREQWDIAIKHAIDTEALTTSLRLLGIPGFIENGRGRARLHLTDFTATQWGDPTRTDTRIALDPVRKSVIDGALLVQDEHFAVGDEVSFVGGLWLDVASSVNVDDVIRHVKKGLGSISAIGASKGLGHGLLQNVEVVELPECDRESADDNAVSLPLALQLVEPFLFAHKRYGKNVYDGGDEITGAAIKAIIAERLLTECEEEEVRYVRDITQPPEAYQDLVRVFDEMTVTHFKPSVLEVGNTSWAKNDGPSLRVRRPLSPPKSIVAVDRDFYDVALQESPSTIYGKTPKFYSSMKAETRERVLQYFADTPPARVQRVHVSIDKTTRAAKEEQLFTDRLVASDKHVWAGEIRFPEEAGKAAQQLLDLLRNGIIGLGKTNAAAYCRTCQPIQHAMQNIAPIADDQQRFTSVITLQTPALLRSPIAVVNGDECLQSIYQDVFKKMVRRNDVEVHLKRCFVSEQLAGSEFLAHVSEKKFKHYIPWVLTQPGSVFVLEFVINRNSNAKEHIIDSICDQLAMWTKHGLPTPHSILSFLQSQNKSDQELSIEDACNFHKANGYGEVALNLRCHTDWRPMAIEASEQRSLSL